MARTLLGYLDKEPTAMDTLEGIAEWWVARQQLYTDIAVLKHVLQRLVRGGVLEVIGEGESTCYRLSQPGANRQAWPR